MAFIDGTAVTVVLPTIQSSMRATAVDAQWVVEAYTLFVAALVLVGGSLGDHLGRRRVFAAGVALFALASVWGGLSPSPEQLIAARAVQGVGGALLVPNSLAIIGASFEEERRGKAIGTWAAFTGVSMMLGPVLGGYLAENLSWRGVFFINVPLALAVLFIAYSHVPESREREARSLDLTGAALVAVGLGGVVFGLLESSLRGLGDPLVVGALVVGAVSLAAFVVVEGYRREPMMPLELFRSRNFTGANVFTLLFYFALGGTLFFLPFNLIQVQEYSATAAGAAILPAILIVSLLSRYVGGLTDRYGARLPLVIGPGIAAVGFALFTAPGVESGSYWTTFFPAAVVLGIGLSAQASAVTTVALNSVEAGRSGLASAINNAFSQTASLLAIAVLGVLMFAVFSSSLDASLDALKLPPEARRQLEEEKIELAAARVPEGLDATVAGAVERAIDEAFVSGFRVVMLVAAGMALASALGAALLIEDKKPKRSKKSAERYWPLEKLPFARRERGETLVSPAKEEELAYLFSGRLRGGRGKRCLRGCASRTLVLAGSPTKVPCDNRSLARCPRPRSQLYFRQYGIRGRERKEPKVRDLVHLAGRAHERRTEVGVKGEKIVSRDGRSMSVRPGSAEPGVPSPVLLAVDEDAGARGRIERELRKRYGEDYRVVCEASAEAAMAKLEAFEAAGEEVALVLADQWMPGTSGMEFLACARRLYPTAKRALLIEWGDRTAQEPILRSMAQGLIDYYVNKPWGSTDEYFHRVISEFLFDWSKARRPGFEEIRVVGERWSPRSADLRDLLWRNGVLHTFYTPDSEQGRELLAQVGQSTAHLPVVVLYDGRVLVDPSNAEIADVFGVNCKPDQRTFDVIVVGGGPSGLGAAVYSASEGLSTLVLEGEAIGGQAGTSSLIRNYLGFPSGVGGAELARRAAEQAWLFGATFRLMRKATGLRRSGGELIVTLSDGTEVVGRSVIIATGAAYRRLGVPSLEALNDAGVFYGATVTEAQAVHEKEVYVAGAGNSAGQAALHLSKYASRVTLVARGDTLSTSMSDYLIKEIEAAENVEVRLNTRVVGGGGKGRLEHLVLEDSGITETVPAAALFVLIGADPHTSWLPEEIKRDKKGYVITGRDLARYGLPRRGWHLGRLPLPLETSMPGVFAAGDVRYGSVKRVASAVGAGAIAIQSVHEYLNSVPQRAGAPSGEVGSLL